MSYYIYDSERYAPLTGYRNLSSDIANRLCQQMNKNCGAARFIYYSEVGTIPQEQENNMEQLFSVLYKIGNGDLIPYISGVPESKVETFRGRTNYAVEPFGGFLTQQYRARVKRSRIAQIERERDVLVNALSRARGDLVDIETKIKQLNPNTKQILTDMELGDRFKFFGSDTVFVRADSSRYVSLKDGFIRNISNVSDSIEVIKVDKPCS